MTLTIFSGDALICKYCSVASPCPSTRAVQDIDIEETAARLVLWHHSSACPITEINEKQKTSLLTAYTPAAFWHSFVGHVQKRENGLRHQSIIRRPLTNAIFAVPPAVPGCASEASTSSPASDRSRACLLLFWVFECFFRAGVFRDCCSICQSSLDRLRSPQTYTKAENSSNKGGYH